MQWAVNSCCDALFELNIMPAQSGWEFSRFGGVLAVRGAAVVVLCPAAAVRKSEVTLRTDPAGAPSTGNLLVTIPE